jgi:hypothetical protein
MWDSNPRGLLHYDVKADAFTSILLSEERPQRSAVTTWLILQCLSAEQVPGNIKPNMLGEWKELVTFCA